MKHIIFILLNFLYIYTSINAQEKFNKIVYDSLGNISNTVIPTDDGYVVLTGTSLNGLRCYAFSKTDNNGNLLRTKRYGHNDYYIYEGFHGCLKRDVLVSQFYLTGIAKEVSTYKRKPLISILNNEGDSIIFDIIDIDSIVGAYDITKYNDSIYVLITQNQINDEYEMGLLLYNINNPENIIKKGYNIENTISTEAGAKIIKTHDNKLLLGGFTFGFSTGTHRQDWYLVKTDSIGNMIWERYYGNPLENDGRIMAMLEAKDSTYIVTGGQAICNWNMNPIFEAALRKIDTAGNLLWEKFYRRYDFNSTEDEIRYSSMYITDIIQLEDNSFIATVDYKKASGDGGAYRFRIFKFNSKGNILTLSIRHLN